MVKAGKSMPETPKDKQLSLRRDKLAQYITEGAVAPTLKAQLKDHKENKPEKFQMLQNHQDMN